MPLCPDLGMDCCSCHHVQQRISHDCYVNVLFTALRVSEIGLRLQQIMRADGLSTKQIIQAVLTTRGTVTWLASVD